MALPVVISRNQVQKTNKRMLPLVIDVVQPTTWYTCPTGKVAVVKGFCQCVNAGAAATMNLVLNGVVIADWTSGGSNVDINNPTALLIGVIFPFTANLDSGDTLTTTQDSGTNAEFKLSAVIEEFNI